MPLDGNAAITSPFSAATACTLCRNSWCSRCALLTNAIVGEAKLASSAISPAWFMPNSTTALRWWACNRNNVSGRPMALLKFPWVASDSSPCHALNMLAIICVTVVLPLLPVTAIKGIENWERQAWESSPSAFNVSATSKPIKPASFNPWLAMAAPTPWTLS